MRVGIFSLCIVLSVFHVLDSFSQSRWIHTYHENIDSPVHGIIESYDKGYLLLGKFGANYSKYNWLIKTDINGEVLWEKTIGDGLNSIALLDICQDISGNTYMCGLSSFYDPARDPLIIKLDTCGEIEWCRDFYTQNNYDFSGCLTLSKDGGIATVLSYTNPLPHTDRICLAKLSTNGKQIWNHCFTSADNHLQNEESNDVILTPDYGFLITGYCFYEDPTEPNHWIPHPYFLKTDSLGFFEWETVVFKETNLDGGAAWSTVISPDSMFYYSSISHYRYDLNQSLPALVKLDMQGNVLEVYDIVNGTKYGVLAYAQFINDSILAASAGWGNNTDSLWSRAVIIDTLGNLLNNAVLLQNDYTSFLQVTYDGKLVYASEDYENGQFDCYLTKLNQNLEQDTLYTRPFTYDSLCPYQIVPDTIVPDDCGLIVGVEEEAEHGGMEAWGHGVLEIWPNPCREILNFKFSILNSGGDYYLSIYDIFGREIRTVKVAEGQDEISVNVHRYSPGVYIAILKKGFDLVESRKFVVAR